MSPLLSAADRSQLAWAMLEDLIHALTPLPFEVAMVTNSGRAASRAAALHWRVLREEHQVSESASVDGASRFLAQEGYQAVLRLPADLPLLLPDDVTELMQAPVAPPCAVLVPSWDRKGTNALLRTPPDLFPSRFGPDSFTRHLHEAEAAGARVKIIENPRLAFDLDDPADLARFLIHPVPGETYRTLMDLKVMERLAPDAG
jgi:2-phospho-L-lactate guanylyltransferase